MEKKIKIGIYTFTAANNYGAVLQAYALKQYLCDEGYDAHCVDYRPQFLVERIQPFSNYNLCGGIKIIKLLKQCIKWKAIRDKNTKFNLFKRYFLSFIPVENSNADVYIIGSDQVWNYKITHGDRIFLGNIANAERNIISYAASMEQQLTPHYIEDFKSQLRNFFAISVREENLRKMLMEDFGVDSSLVVDPTLLLTPLKWKIMSRSYDKVKGRFIFMYGFGFTPAEVKATSLYAKKHNFSIIIASSGVLFRRDYRNDIDPQQFIWLMDHAECIITNSFHGTVFSLIFGKRFVEIKNHSLNKNTRVESLLKKAGLNSEPCDIYGGIKDSDFMSVSSMPKSLIDAIKESERFLKTSINRV